MFEFESGYVKMKLVDCFVKCAKLLKHVMSKESYCVISNFENSSSLIVNGESCVIFFVTVDHLLSLSNDKFVEIFCNSIVNHQTANIGNWKRQVKLVAVFNLFFAVFYF